MKPAWSGAAAGAAAGASSDATAAGASGVVAGAAQRRHVAGRVAGPDRVAQALLAVMASMYAVYHGPQGLRRIAHRVHAFALALRQVERQAALVSVR